MKNTIIIACLLSASCASVQCMENLLPNMQNDEETAPLRPREAAEEDHEEDRAIDRYENSLLCSRRPDICLKRAAQCLGIVMCAGVLSVAGVVAYSIATNPVTPYNITR